MPEIQYRGRRAHALENEHLRVVVTVEGGHIACIEDKASGVNPLWTPPWPSIEPSSYDPAQHPEYGLDAESKLLAGIMGHNLCLDLFGGPSAEEAAAGMTVHGEASVAEYAIAVSGDTLTSRVTLRESQLAFRRTLRLAAGSRTLDVEETVENLTAWDKPVAWTQHATLGPPFLEKGKTLFHATAKRSKVFETDFTAGKGHLKPAAEFDWPMAPCVDGSLENLERFTSRPATGAFTTHLMDPGLEEASFTAWSPTLKLTFGYAWRRSDFPWLGIWEENYVREAPPWNGKTLTRGMEFGASPFPETRRSMIDRGSLFGVPGFRWIAAKSTVSVKYRAFLRPD
jgi:hypothetical protein